MQSRAATVDDYIDSLPPDRRDTLIEVRKVVLAHLHKDFAEGMQYGMVGYFVPHSVFPPGYHCNPKEPLPFAGLASQKQHLSLYFMCLYADSKLMSTFRAEWARSGKKLDMGKSCIRFKSADDLHFPAITQLLKSMTAQSYIEVYESMLKSPRPATAKKSAKKSPAKSKAPAGKPKPKAKAKTANK